MVLDKTESKCNGGTSKTENESKYRESSEEKDFFGL